MSSRDTWQLPAFDHHPITGERLHGYALGIPVLNEGERLHSELARIRDAGIHREIDVMIADGGSSDGSVEPEALAALGVHTLLVKTGPGALSAQLRMFLAHALDAGYDGVVLIDGNDKDGIEAIPRFTAALNEGWDYLQGSRYIPGGHHENTPRLRELGVRFLHAPLLSLASRVRYTDTTNGFRALSRRFLLDPRVQPFREVFDTYNLHYYLSRQAGRLGFRVKEVPVSRVYPKRGETPTKISGLGGNLEILRLLFHTVTGRYDPPPPRENPS